MSNIRLMQGDCLERMKEIESGTVDMILADPPYGTTACKWDSVIPLEPMWEQLKRVIKPSGAIVMTASQPFTTTLIGSNLKMFKYCWVWDKANAGGGMQAKIQPLRSHEDVVVFCSGKTTYYPQMVEVKRRVDAERDIPNGDAYSGKTAKRVYDNKGKKYPKTIIGISNANQRGKTHPTQKPVALMEYMIKTYTHEGEAVLDFTMGSGTTGVACKNLNRSFIGIELDEAYFKIAQDRISAA